MPIPNTRGALNSFRTRHPTWIPTLTSIPEATFGPSFDGGAHSFFSVSILNAANNNHIFNGAGNPGSTPDMVLAWSELEIEAKKKQGDIWVYDPKRVTAMLPVSLRSEGWFCTRAYSTHESGDRYGSCFVTFAKPGLDRTEDPFDGRTMLEAVEFGIETLTWADS